MDSNNKPQKFCQENRLKYRKILFYILVFLIFYVGSYIALSVMGNYVPSQSGEYRLRGSGIAVTDVMIWKPKFTYWRIYKNIDGEKEIQANLLGYFYAPLIYIDQGLIRYSCLLGQGLKIPNRVPIQAYRNGLLEVFGIGIFTPLHGSKVIVLSHDHNVQTNKVSVKIFYYPVKINRRFHRRGVAGSSRSGPGAFPIRNRS